MAGVAMESKRHIAVIEFEKLDDGCHTVTSLDGQIISLQSTGMSIYDARNNFLYGFLCAMYFSLVDRRQSEVEDSVGVLEAELTVMGATHDASIQYLRSMSQSFYNKDCRQQQRRQDALCPIAKCYVTPRRGQPPSRLCANVGRHSF